jgi:hypothetical protein
MSRPPGPFEVVSALPPGEDNSSSYRVKSKAEAFVRVARETDLVAVGLAPSKQPAPVRWADFLPNRLGRPERGDYLTNWREFSS